MDYRDSAEVINILQKNYLNSFAKAGEDQADVMVKTWEIAFKNFKKDVVEKALIRAMLIKKDYPPTIADVGEEVAVMTDPAFSALDGEQAWIKAVEIAHEVELRRVAPSAEAEHARSDAAVRTAQTEFPLVWKAMLGMGGADEFLNMNTTLKSQFVRLYNSYRKSDLKRILLPDILKTQKELLWQPNGLLLLEQENDND